MIRRHMIMSAVAATIALAGCSGGDDDASPTPTPTGTPTPTPTASPTYAAFPLTGASEFTALSAATSYTGDPAAGAVTLGVAGTDKSTGRVRLATSPTIASATYVIRENTEESRFTNTNIQTPSATTNTEFSFRTDDATTAGKFSQLEFLNNTIPSTVTSDAGLALTRVSYANWWRGDSTTGAKRLTYSVFGYPTVITDLPTTGTQAYSARIAGRLVSVAGGATTIARVGGTVTLSVNFATGLVDMTLNLTTLPPGGGAAVPYGVFTAQGALPVGENQFTGSFTTGSPLSGTIAGSFFGSRGEQIGITFAGSGANGGADQRLVGEVVGKKQ